jgi:D-3-phosphoglycerate dehydrogenase
VITNSKPLVVLCGPIHPAAIDVLQSETRVVITEEVSVEGVIGAASEAEAILFRIDPPCTERLLASCPKLRVVGRHGVGLDTVDLPAATRLGIAVVHAPGVNSNAVAEHAIMLMLCVIKKLVPVDRVTRQGEWRGPTSRGIGELKGLTLGIIGVGNIGRRVAELAHAFGMRVLGYDPYLPADEILRRGTEPVAELASLLQQSDIVSCHTPYTKENQRMFNEGAIAQMKQGAIFINTSRGNVQDDRALYNALASGKLKGAGLDVFEEEPVPLDNPLLKLDNVVCTSHIAGVSEQAYRSIGLQVAEEILRVLRGERPMVLGNPELWPRLSHLR